MSRILFYMKQSSHRNDSLPFMKKLEAHGFFCRMCGECPSVGLGGEECPPVELNGEECPPVGSDGENCLSVGLNGEECSSVGLNGKECPPVGPDGGERALVITDDEEAAAVCELRKTACIGYCPAGSEETESGRSGYFPHVRLVWESFADREPEELKQFLCRFYGDPVVIARTERLLLRESIPEDFEAIYQMESCSSYCEEKEKFCSYIKTVYPFYGYGYWTAVLTEPGREGTVIGRCGLKDYEPGEDDGYIVMKKEAGDELLRKSVLVLPQESEFGEGAEPEVGSELQQVFPSERFCLELGYIVAEPYRGQGYACEMCRAALDYAFTILHADAVVVRIHPQNRASLGLARKLGFCRGTLHI